MAKNNLPSRFHHTYHHHMLRVLFASIAILSVALLHMPATVSVATTSRGQSSVLAYATDITIGDLTTATNTARAQNGLGGLTLNSRLNNAAQMKANDMIANNYWAHVSPNGTQPWYWFSAAGYEYTNAGENLAYGFATSSDTVAGWMNSAGHRANILGNYQDVGFGIANGENFQGGQNTVVVAHYGTPRSQPASVTPSTPAATTPTVTPSTAQPTAAAPVVPTTTPSQPSGETPTNTEPAKAAEEKPVEKAQPTTSASAQNAQKKPAQQATVRTASSTAIPVWQQLLRGNVPIIVLVSLGLLACASIGYMATHLSLAKRAALLGEQYVLHHPMIDASVAVAASFIILFTTVGRIG